MVPLPYSIVIALVGRYRAYISDILAYVDGILYIRWQKLFFRGLPELKQSSGGLIAEGADPRTLLILILFPSITFAIEPSILLWVRKKSVHRSSSL